MKIRILLLLPAIAVLLLVQSCAGPRNIVKFLPQEQPSKWINGQPLQGDSAYGIRYEIGFDRIADGNYWFDFHITNQSNLPLLIDPVQFRCRTYTKEMVAKTPFDQFAVDPEGKISELEQETARNESVARNHVGNVLLGVGAAIAANVLLGIDNPRNENVRAVVTDGIMATAVSASDIAANQVYNLNQLRDLWENNTIRKTTLDANYVMHGKVFFPATRNAAYLKLFIPVDDVVLEFTWMQLKNPTVPQLQPGQ